LEFERWGDPTRVVSDEMLNRHAEIYLQGNDKGYAGF